MSTTNEQTNTTVLDKWNKTRPQLNRRCLPALKEAMWPLSTPSLFTVSRALMLYWSVWAITTLYWSVWAITTLAKPDLGTTNHQHIDMALSMSSIKALWITICLVGNTIRCLVVLNLTYLFFLLGLSFCTWVLIRGYLGVVKPYHRGRFHLADVRVLSRVPPLGKWSRRRLEGGYPEVDGFVADYWEWMNVAAKPGAGSLGGGATVMSLTEIFALARRQH